MTNFSELKTAFQTMVDALHSALAENVAQANEDAKALAEITARIDKTADERANLVSFVSDMADELSNCAEDIEEIDDRINLAFGEIGEVPECDVSAFVGYCDGCGKALTVNDNILKLDGYDMLCVDCFDDITADEDEDEVTEATEADAQ